MGTRLQEWRWDLIATRVSKAYLTLMASTKELHNLQLGHFIWGSWLCHGLTGLITKLDMLGDGEPGNEAKHRVNYCRGHITISARAACYRGTCTIICLPEQFQIGYFIYCRVNDGVALFCVWLTSEDALSPCALQPPMPSPGPISFSPPPFASLTL